MEAVTRRHFFHHGGANPSALAGERKACHFCQIRSFATHATLPITIVNDQDDSRIPERFRFIDSSILGEGVERAEEGFRSGCDCQDDEDCQYGSCECLSDIVGTDDEGSGDERGAKKRLAYHSGGEKAGLLRRKFLNSRDPIYECHDRCSCSRYCPNRVVERGRQVPLQIFRTENRGWGVRTMADLKKGQFVDRYLGEIITSEEASRRRDESEIAQSKDVYLFALDKFSDQADAAEGPPFEVDGEFMSGPTRFINHSCEPNLRIFARVGDHIDRHIHDLALFAVQDIGKGEELTFDYVDGVQNPSLDANDPSKQGEMTRCLCGTKKCRGFLW